MIFSLLRKDSSREGALALYDAAAAQSRASPFYSAIGVADTPEGRFEMLALHVFLLLRRLKGEGDGARRVSQKLFDAFFENLDDGLRELGVGDLSVGKKIRRLAEAFYGRSAAYDSALAPNAAPNALVESLERNIFGAGSPAGATALAGYVRAASAMLEAQPSARLLLGVARFPEPPLATEARAS